MLVTSVIGWIDAVGGWPIAAKLYGRDWLRECVQWCWWCQMKKSSGVAGLSFVILWEMRAANKPRHSSYVTATELDYIRGKRLKRGMLSDGDTRTPYKKVVGHHHRRILNGPHVLTLRAWIQFRNFNLCKISECKGSAPNSFGSFRKYTVRFHGADLTDLNVNCSTTASLCTSALLVCCSR